MNGTKKAIAIVVGRTGAMGQVITQHIVDAGLEVIAVARSLTFCKHWPRSCRESALAPRTSVTMPLSKSSAPVSKHRCARWFKVRAWPSPVVALSATRVNGVKNLGLASNLISKTHKMPGPGFSTSTAMRRSCSKA